MGNHIGGSVSHARHHRQTPTEPASDGAAAGNLQSSTGEAFNLSSAPYADNAEIRHLLAPRRQILPDQLPNKAGVCVSRQDTEDGRPSNSSSASSSANFPARPSTSVFEYRTAELSEANVDGICVGLTAEWLLNLNNSASNRMAALRPGSESHASAATRQQQYQDLTDSLRRQGAGSAQADLQAQNTMLQEAGLAPSGKEKKYQYGEPSSFSRMLDKITRDGSTHLLSLYFAEGGAHTIATSASKGMTTLFDPNYGELLFGRVRWTHCFKVSATAIEIPTDNIYRQSPRKRCTDWTAQKNIDERYA